MGSGVSAGSEGCLSVRPEQIRLSREAGADSLEVVVQNRIFLGEHTEYLVTHAILGEFLVLSPRQTEMNDGPFNAGESLTVSWDAGTALVLEQE